MSAIQDSLRTITGKLDDIGQLKQSIETINKDLWDEHRLDERIKYIGPRYEKTLPKSKIQGELLSTERAPGAKVSCYQFK